MQRGPGSLSKLKLKWYTYTSCLHLKTIVEHYATYKMKHTKFIGAEEDI